MTDKVYRVIVVGPTGAGKSQFCNFVRRDISNSINTVSDSLDSCTKDPFSNFFPRKSTNYEFIDTAGNSDSSDDDTINLKKLVCYLKEKKTIDYIILVLKFNERVTNETRNYIKILGKIFTPGEFYNHLCVTFTKFPVNPSKKEEKIKKNSINEINKILKEAFNIDINQKTPDVNVYFVDTEIDEEEGKYEEKYQDTIDTMMEFIKLKVETNGSIGTLNLDITGESAKNRMELQKKQISELKKKLEKEKLRREKEEQDRIRLNQELERTKMNDEIRKKKEIELQEIMRKQNEERRRLEEIERINRAKAEENERRQRAIEEEARKKGIEIERLDNILDGCGNVAALSYYGGGLLGGALFGGAVLLNAIGGVLCPPVAVLEAMALSGLGIGAVSTVTLAGSGVVAGITKVHKELIK